MSVTARSVVCNLLLNQLFVLTQHPSKHQLLSNSPGKAIRACAPKVLSEPGPQLDWFWIWIWTGGCLVDLGEYAGQVLPYAHL